MIVSTTENIPNKDVVEILGIARGSTVRARNVGRDIFAAVKNLIGGEISEEAACSGGVAQLCIFTV